jgi:hypothetical protein
MAVAFYVTGISTPEVHPEFPPLLGTLTADVGRALGATETVASFDDVADAFAANKRATWELFWTERTKSA